MDSCIACIAEQTSHMTNEENLSTSKPRFTCLSVGVYILSCSLHERSRDLPRYIYVLANNKKKIVHIYFPDQVGLAETVL